MKKAMLLITLIAGLAGGSRSLADIITPTAPPSITLPAGWSLLSVPPNDLNTVGLPSNWFDDAYFWSPWGWLPHTFDGWAGFWMPPLPWLGLREAFAYRNNSGGPVTHSYPYQAPIATWDSLAPWTTGAPSVLPTGLQNYHLLGWNGLEAGTFERIIDHIPHYHQYAIMHRLIDPATATYRAYTFANGRWFPEAPVLDAAEGAFFQLGPGTGPAVSVQFSGVTPSQVLTGPTATAVDVDMTGRFLSNPTIQLFKSYNPNMGAILTPSSTQISGDKRVVRATFDLSTAGFGDYDVQMNWPSGPSPRELRRGIRLIDPTSSIYHIVEGSTLLQNNNQTVNYEVTFQNDTGSPATVDVRFYAQHVYQSNPGVPVQNLLHFLDPGIAGGISPTLGVGGSAWKYANVSVPVGSSTLTVPVTLDSAAVAPYQSNGNLPLRYALEVSWKLSSSSLPWSDPVWMPSFIIP